MNRRQFLRNSAVGIGSFAFSGLIIPGKSTHAASHISLGLTAEPSTTTMTNGVSLPTWQYRSVNSGPGNLNAGFIANPGDHLVIVLRNNLDRPINLVIPGLLENTPACQPGALQSYSVTLPLSGSFMITDALNGELARAMGLAAPLVINNTADTLGNGQILDQSYTLVTQDFDSRLNQAISAGQTFNLDNYAPDYYQINGLSYPNTLTDPSCYINAVVNQNIAIRFINAGLICYPMHFHGYHVNVINRNRIVETQVIEKDTVSILPDECVDTALLVNQPGQYPVHSHYLPATTANGIYANGGNPALNEAAMGGGLLMINAVV